MHITLHAMKRAISCAELLPALGAVLWVLLLFAAGLWVAHEFAMPIRAAVTAWPMLGLAVFVLSSAVAVLLPMLSNLPLVPMAVLAWGPWWTASLLLLGWVLGAALSFALGRRARPLILRLLPSVGRHADIDRLIHPEHRLLSLVLLRMTFPVDVLSYALGMFSRKTSSTEQALSTLIGAAPFALLFAWVPALPAATQITVFAVTTLMFAAHVLWVLRGH